MDVSKEFEILGKRIVFGGRPYLIAEAGSNHNQSLDTAKALVDIAVDAGADAIKWQLFQADELYKPGDELYDIFKSIEFPQDWLEVLPDYCKERDIAFIASPFDIHSTDRLVQAGAAALKVASSETVNLSLLAHLAGSGLPLIISTGMCELSDVVYAVELCREVGSKNIALLQCSSLYPTRTDQLHLRVIESLYSTFRLPVGLSDHTPTHTGSIAATALGACIIEKHITLDRSSSGPDHFYALEPGELKELRSLLNEAHGALGSFHKRFLPEEKEIARRDGLHAADDLEAGERLTNSNFETRRPATGIRAGFRDAVAGARIKADIQKGMPIQWDQIDV